MSRTLSIPHIRTSLIATGIALSSFGSAHAGYDFRMIGGQPIYDVGSSICLDLTQDSADNVKFSIWSLVPQPVTSIEIVEFDTGSHKDLFSDMSVVSQSPGGTIRKAPPSDPYYRGHAYLPRFTPHYIFRKEGTTLYHPGGISIGKTLILSATLANGRTAADVVAALKEGSNPATETSGLRIGVIVYHLKGKRRDPNVTEGDDGGFVTNTFSSRCQRR